MTANPFSATSQAAMSGMKAQAFRLRIVSENLANADTHGYRRKLVTFGNVYDRQLNTNLVEVGRVQLDSKARERVFDPSHPFADEEGYVTMSNVDMMTEFADAREAGRSYEAGLEIFRQARKMYTTLLDVLKR